MAINLSKGGRINLEKEAPLMTKVRMGLGWKPNTFNSGSKYDLDVTAFVLKQDASGKSVMLSEEYMIFYNQTSTPEGSVKHLGDNRTGDGDGDDETILVELPLIPAVADEISFIVTIHDAVARKQNFGQVPGCYVKMYDADATPDAEGNLPVIMQYDLEDDFSNETAVQFGSLYKKDGKWGFKAVGQGFNAGLKEFCEGYGGEVA